MVQRKEKGGKQRVAQAGVKVWCPSPVFTVMPPNIQRLFFPLGLQAPDR
jgi:hypothetical protein